MRALLGKPAPVRGSLLAEIRTLFGGSSEVGPGSPRAIEPSYIARLSLPRSVFPRTYLQPLGIRRCWCSFLFLECFVLNDVF